MINLILALCLSTSSITHQTCDTGCVVQIKGDKKITVSDLPQYVPNREGVGYEAQLCGMVFKLHKKEVTVNIFKPDIAKYYIDYSDSTFTKDIGNNSVSFYRQKKKNVAQWFSVISSKNCDSKWFAFLNSKDMPVFEEVISEITFSRQ